MIARSDVAEVVGADSAHRDHGIAAVSGGAVRTQDDAVIVRVDRRDLRRFEVLPARHAR